VFGMLESAPENLKPCGRCGEVKPVANFAWRRKARGQRDNYCRPCRAEYHREQYAANRQRYIDNAVRRKKEVAAERAAYLFEFFRSRPCADCGETDPLVLEFDHLADKAFNIAKGLRDRNWQTVIDESQSAMSSVQTATGVEPRAVGGLPARR
jgi:hypothetical protein